MSHGFYLNCSESDNFFQI